jgi:hypothetical protein
MDDCATKSVGSSQRLFGRDAEALRVRATRADLATVWEEEPGRSILSIVSDGKQTSFWLSPSIKAMLLSELAADIIKGCVKSDNAP